MPWASIPIVVDVVFMFYVAMLFFLLMMSKSLLRGFSMMSSTQAVLPWVVRQFGGNTNDNSTASEPTKCNPGMSKQVIRSIDPKPVHCC